MNLKSLVVFDVGHGNWNALVFNDLIIHFDVGADRTFNKGQVNDLSRELMTWNRDQILILSHWDVDHYQVIFGDDFKNNQYLSLVIAPTPPVNNDGNRPQTIQRAIDILEGLGIRIEFIDPKEKSSNYDRRGVQLLEHTDDHHVTLPEYISNRIQLYRTTGARNKNLDCIVVYGLYESNSILLTGDLNYEKFIKYIPDLMKIGTPLDMIVPHHGGSAGRLNINDWRSTSLYRLTCSWCQNNTYGHSFKYVSRKFSTIPIKEETNCNGHKMYNFCVK